jgi:glycosyltransferase involved in cell wall biosynthesis
MLRIVHVTGFTSSKYGGFERFMVSLGRQCAARGHQFYCLMEAPPFSRQFKSDLEAAGARIVVMPARGRRVPFTLGLARWMYEKGIQVVHTHFTPSSTLALVAGRLAGVPLLVSHIHSGFAEERRRNVSFRFREMSRIRRSLASRVLVSAKCVGEQFHRVEGGGREALVYYLGVDVVERSFRRAAVRQELGLSPEDTVLVCVAFHAPVKGVDVLIEAMGLLRSRFPRMRLIQVGGPEEPLDPLPTELLKRQAERAGMADRILWLGYRNDVPDLLAAGDIYCLPSRSEGLPLAVLEAMGAGLPVVGSAVGGVLEAVEHGRTGLLVPSESPQALASAIASLLSDEGMRRRLGAEGRAVVRQRFDIDRQSCLLLDLYESMWQSLSLP